MEDNASGSESGSETTLPSSSSTEQSVTNYKKKNTKPCKICGANEDDDDVIKCYKLPMWLMKCYKPPMWLCEVCRNSFGVVVDKPEDAAEDSTGIANSGGPNHTVSSASSRVDGQNTESEPSQSQSEAHTSPEASLQKQSESSDNETSGTNQPSESQAHTSPEASSPVSTDTSSVREQRQSDSNSTPSGSESAK